MRLNVRNLIIWLLIIAVVVAFHTVRRNSTMRGIETVVRNNGVCLLDEGDVDSLILASFPTLLQTDIKRVEKKKIRQMLKEHPYVADAEVGMSTGGKLQVKVIQREPLVRVFYQDNEFYISEQGTIMPLCSKHFCDVMVGSREYAHEDVSLSVENGSDSLGGSLVVASSYSLACIWAIARFIHDNPRYDGVFDQVTVNAKGDLVLTPKLGSTMVVVGDTLMLAEKFENLWAFYEQGVKKMGWDTYSAINLKYRGQLVCTKR